MFVAVTENETPIVANTLGAIQKEIAVIHGAFEIGPLYVGKGERYAFLTTTEATCDSPNCCYELHTWAIYKVNPLD